MVRKANEEVLEKTEGLALKASDTSCYVIPSFNEFDIAEYRKSLNMNQAEFAKVHNVSLGTLKKWERKSSKPIFSDGLKSILHSWLNKQLTELRT